MKRLFFILFFITELQAEPIAFSTQQIDSLGIQTQAVMATQTKVGGHLPASVIAPPKQIHVVSAPQSGLIQQVRVAVGENVRQGQLLAKLQSRALITLQRDYLQVLTQHSLALAHYQRDKQLFADEIIAKRRFLDTQSQWAEAKANLAAQTQVLQLAGMSAAQVQNLRKNRKLSGSLDILAPAAGVLLKSNIASGQRVDDMDSLFQIADLSHLWLEIRAPLDRLDDLSVGTGIEVDGTAATGRIILIGREVDPDNQTVLVRAELDQALDSLRVGQFVETHINTATEQAYYQVPKVALARQGKDIVVFTQTEGGFEPQSLRLISEHDDYAVVDAPLANKSVAISGISAIKAAWQGLGGE